jgi:hypothetical protein
LGLTNLILVAVPFAFRMRAAFAAHTRPLIPGDIFWNLFGAWIAVGGSYLIGTATAAALDNMACNAGKSLENCDGFLAAASYLMLWATALAWPLGGIVAFAFMPVTLLGHLTPR